MGGLSPKQWSTVRVLLHAAPVTLIGLLVVLLIVSPHPVLIPLLCIVSLVAFFHGLVLHYRWSRRRFLAGREPMGDDEFIRLGRLDAEERELVVLIRQGMADGYEYLPREYVRPDDKVHEIANRTCMTPMDSVGLVIVLEDYLGVEITDELCYEQLIPTRLYNSATVAELVRHIITKLGEEGLLKNTAAGTQA